MNTNSIISLATSQGKYFFNSEEIIRLEASSNYTKIFFCNNTKLISAKVLKSFAKQLTALSFIRTHRAHLVNRLYIHCITPQGNVIMKDASVAEISSRMKSGVMKLLKEAA